jgi:hypothetical protein
LKSLQKKYKTQFLKCSIPESKSYIYETTIANVAPGDEEDAVAFTIEERAPVSLADVVFDYRVTCKTKQNKIVSVGVVPHEVVASNLDMFGKAGFKVLGLEVEAQAVANAVVAKGSKENVIIVTIKPEKTVIAIVENGGVFMSTTVEIGSKTFDAARSKQGEGDETNGAFLEPCSLLKNYINKYYIYWLTHKDATCEQKEVLDRVIVVGKEAAVPGFIDYLKSNLKLRVEAANVWINCFDINKHVPEIPFAESFDYAEVIGLLASTD